MDARQQAIKVDKVAGPYEDSNFDLIGGVRNDLGVIGVVVGLKPRAVDARKGEVIMQVIVSPMEAGPSMATIIKGWGVGMPHKEPLLE